MKSKTVYITGATGFLGCHLTCKMLKQGHRVVALVRQSACSNTQGFQRVSNILKKIDTTVQINTNLILYHSITLFK
jgi:nucleoside-diphosphate-sugar epimerase